MEKLKEYIKQQWFTVYKSLSPEALNDIYVFSFFMYDDDDDPRRPTLTIGYNTLSNYHAQIKFASDKNEAKWNYAFWLQNQLANIGTQEDNVGRHLINDSIIENKHSYTDEEANNSFDACMEIGEQIAKNFVDLLVQIVQETHVSKLTKLPILIHELEYYEVIRDEVIRDQNIAANGEERVKEFTQWINNLYEE
jgi:hypothetical protein